MGHKATEIPLESVKTDSAQPLVAGESRCLYCNFCPQVNAYFSASS